MNDKGFGPKILELKEAGKSFSEIKRTLKCSESLIVYHTGVGQKQKAVERYKIRIKNNPLLQKVQTFLTGAIDRFTTSDVLDKIGENPKCYLTGDEIDIHQGSTYHLDHIIPLSRGGSRTLDNLGLATKMANMSKTDMTLDEYFNHCKKVLENNGYIVIKK